MNDTIKSRSRGFTLTEILVVIGIVVLLISILIPVVSKARRAAQVATVNAQINDLAGIIQQYAQDYGGALPGPLTYQQIRMPSGFTLDVNTTSTEFDGNLDERQITMSENLVLALAGGLKAITNTTSPSATPTIVYDPSLVGAGAMSLNPANPKKGKTYIDQKNLSWRIDAAGRKTGKYEDAAGAARDSEIPEILDTFPSPMPILYLRARKGQQPPAGTTPDNWTDKLNYIITYDDQNSAADARVGQYDLSQISGYTQADLTGRFIGEGKKIDVNEYAPTKPTSAGNLPHGLGLVERTFDGSMLKDAPTGKTYYYPYEAGSYFRDPASTDANPQPRAKDGFILISAGLDRVYGTADDITSFGPVTQ